MRYNAAPGPGKGSGPWKSEPHYEIMRMPTSLVQTATKIVA